MIHIGGDWYLDGKAPGILLKQKKVFQKGAKIGQEYYVIAGSYRTFQNVFDALVEKEVRLTIGESRVLMQVNKGVADIHSMIADFYEKYGKEIEKKLKEESGDAGIEREDGTERDDYPIGE